MADDRKDLPPITAPNFLERVREVLSVYLGNRGDVLNRGVTLRDMVDGGMATLDARFAGGGKGIAPLVPTIPTVTVDTTYVLDLTPPPAPTGFSASAALTTIIIRSDGASYTAGHGPAKSRLYGATGVLSQTAELTIASPCIVTLTKPISTSQRIQFSSTGSLPTGVSAGVTYYAKNVNGLSCEISATDGGASINTSGSQSGAHSAFFYPTFDATHLLTPKLTEFSGSIFNYSTNPATTWHLWLTWVTADGVESVTPAGGTNGVVVTTGQDVSRLVAAMTGTGNPFKVVPYDITLPDGSTVPAGTYTADAFIHRAQISAAQIGSVSADSINTGVLEAVVSHTGVIYNGVAAYTLSAPDPVTNVITATATGYTPGTVNFGTGYYMGQLSGTPTLFVGSPTKHVYWDGTNLVIKGTVYATTGQIGGNTIDATGVQSPGYVAGSTGWRLDTSGLIKAFANAGARVFNMAATGTESVLKVGTALDLKADGTATFVGAITAASGSFGGSLDAASGTLGALTLAAGGNVKAGQTAYNTGTGFFLGYSGVTPVFSIGSPTGAHMRWDGTDLYVNTPTFDAFSASIPLGNLTVSVPLGIQTYGSRSVAVSGGKAGYTYTWVSSSTGGGFVFIGGQGTATVSLSGTGDGITNTSNVLCFVRDANGRTTMTSFVLSATHGASGG